MPTLPPTTNVSDSVAKSRGVKDAAAEKAKAEIGEKLIEQLTASMSAMTDAISVLTKMNKPEDTRTAEQRYWDEMHKALKAQGDQISKAVTKVGEFFSKGIIGKFVSYNPVLATIQTLLSESTESIKKGWEIIGPSITLATKPMVHGMLSFLKDFKSTKDAELEALREKRGEKGHGAATKTDKLLDAMGLGWLADMAEIAGFVVKVGFTKMLGGLLALSGNLLALSTAVGALIAAFHVPDSMYEMKLYFRTFWGELGHLIHEMKHMKAKNVFTEFGKILSNIKPVRAVADKINGIASSIGNAINSMKNFGSELSAFGKFWGSIFKEMFKMKLPNLVNMAKKIFDEIVYTFYRLEHWVKGLGESRFIKPIMKLFGFVGKVFQKLIGPLSYLSAAWENLNSDWMKEFSGDSIASKLRQGLAFAVTTLIGGAAKFAISTIGLVMEAFVDLPTFIIGKILSFFGADELGSFLSETEFTEPFLNMLKSSWKSIVEGIGEMFVSMDKGTFMEDAWNFFGNVIGFLFDSLGNMFESIFGWLDEKIGEFSDWLGIDLPKMGVVPNFGQFSGVQMGGSTTIKTLPPTPMEKKQSEVFDALLQKLKDEEEKKKQMPFMAPIIIGGNTVQQNNNNAGTNDYSPLRTNGRNAGK